MAEYRLEKVYKSVSNPAIEIPINELEQAMEDNKDNSDYNELYEVLKRVFFE